MTPDTETDEGDVRFVRQLIGLDYAVRTNPVARAFGEALAEGRITGHRCPSCGLVYVPPKGFCPICTVPTGSEHEVAIADRGIVTSWTVLTPIQYAGQEEREDYALASLLLEGADGTVGQQRLVEVALDEIRMGLRVEAVWAPEGEREPDDRGYGLGTAITGWRPTGEPDAPADAYREHVL
ncbi:Zn-ribbon domain-containing OB-fold protein [Iamia majanohamensis]|uniref:Zn-ribbon domain-containing OB-fold protein n=1 Tax=Iamia majanohamensis TaxID=467976 RepID=A0AAE9Y4N1_9ACTN|nr:Zn-ribbon domain-containing OB-fold protein [Iamia majanohamensis]WCO66135.1 Zn-ribbon domain-containing OB-fold protein [Iamia majanohamensis]